MLIGVIIRRQRGIFHRRVAATVPMGWEVSEAEGWHAIQRIKVQHKDHCNGNLRGKKGSDRSLTFS